MEPTNGIWSGETLQNRMDDLVPEKCLGTRVDKIAIELCLGKEVFISGNPTKKSVQLGEQISIPPGQMALLLTEERIRIPPNAMGFISMKSTVKLHGLVNISGFHVDPGYDGRLVFSVSNSGPTSVPLTRGEPLFMLFVCSLDQATSRIYDGTRRNLNSIRDDMVAGLQGHFPSPQMLQDQIRTIRDNVTEELAQLHARVTRIKWWAGTIGVVLGAVLSGVGIAIWTALSTLMARK